VGIVFLHKSKMVAVIVVVSLLSLNCGEQQTSIKPVNQQVATPTPTPADYIQSFHPYIDPEQISIVNRRAASPAKCQLKRSDASWKTFDYKDAQEYQHLLARKVRTRGSSLESWGVFELDPESVEAALQIGASEGHIDASELDTLRLKARKQLFKPGARTFALMHSYDDVWAMSYPEPKLLSETESVSGRLVGMSISSGLGIRTGEIGIIKLEDRVCETDMSYAIEISFIHGRDSKDLVQYNGSVTKRFIFAGEGNLLTLLQSVYRNHVPLSQSHPTYEDNTQTPLSQPGSVMSLSDLISIIGLALQLVELLIAL
jgi:hypothetical protein